MTSPRFSALVLAAVCAAPLPALAQTFSTAPQPQGDADRLAAAMRTLGSNPQNVEALVTAAELSLRLGDAAGAASLFARADKVDPRNARVKAGMGALLVHEERPGEALRYFNMAEGYGLAPARFAAERGLAYDLIGEQERAQRDYRAALATGPDEEVQRRYALSLGIAGKQEEALGQIDALVRKNDRGAWRARAFILAMTGDVAGANKIATTMMPGAMATGLAPFFERLPRLPAVDRAFAVHFGEVRPTPQRLADARLTPALPVLAPEPGRATMLASLRSVQVAQPTARERREQEREARRQRRAGGSTQVAAVDVPARTSTVTPRAAVAATPRTVAQASPRALAAATVTTPRPLASATAASAPVQTAVLAPVTVSPRRPTFASAPNQVAGTGVFADSFARLRLRAAQEERARALGAGTTASVAPRQLVNATTPPSPTAALPLARSATSAAPPAISASPIAAVLPSAAPTSVPTPAPVALAARSSATITTPPTSGTPAGTTIGSTATVTAAPAPLRTAATAPTVPRTAAVLPAAASPSANTPAPTAITPAATPRPAPVAATTTVAPTPTPSAAATAAQPAATPSSQATAALVTAPATSAAIVAAVPANQPTAPRNSESSLLERIVSGISVPASELGVAPPVAAAATPPTAAPVPTATPRAIAEIKAPIVKAELATPRPATARPVAVTRAETPARVRDEEAPASTKSERATRTATTSRRGDAPITATKARTADTTTSKRRAAADDEDTTTTPRKSDRVSAARKPTDRKEPEAKGEPPRIWVQVAGGANDDDLAKAWRTQQGKAAALKGKAAYSTPLRATNRVVTGPFKTDAEARAFVNTLAKQGVSAFPFTSDKGQKMTKLPPR